MPWGSGRFEGGLRRSIPPEPANPPQSRISRSQQDREYRRFTSQLAHRYTIIPMMTNDFEAAAALTQHHPLKAYDAVQLAVALRHDQALVTRGFTLTFVSGDKALVTAAQVEGLRTDNPFDHGLPQDTPTNAR